MDDNVIKLKMDITYCGKAKNDDINVYSNIFTCKWHENVPGLHF